MIGALFETFPKGKLPMEHPWVKSVTSCDKVYNLDENMRGKIVRCRECQAMITVTASPPPRQERREEIRRPLDDRRPERREDSRRPLDDRIASSRPAAEALRSRRNEEEDAAAAARLEPPLVTGNETKNLGAATWR